MPKLETIEWSNMWLDHPADKTKKRVLLVGDSITRGYTDFVKGVFGDSVYVDAFTTSRATDNEAFATEVFYVIDNADYNIIYFNNGLHGMHQGTDDYEKKYEAVIERIIKENPNTKLILGLSTPITESGDTKTLDKKNEIIKERNKAVERIAKRHGLEVNDIYSAVLGNSEIRSDDGYHYNSDGYKILGEKIANLLKMLQ